ncbi:MAG: beta-carotene 15,15'-dioxygenase, Brp/Blh family [Flavobacteriales bacterium]
MSDTSYSYVFIGLGCGNSLLLMALERHGLLANRSVLVIEPSLKDTNDRTFCFWQSPESIEENQLSSLIAHEWSCVTVGGEAAQRLEGKKYYHVTGLSLYEKAREILSKYNIPIVRVSYAKDPVINNGLCTLTLADKRITAQYVFDNRPPSYALNRFRDVSLYQSFYGWEIEAPSSTFDSDGFTMMDFEVSQGNATQFMYILPFSDQRALFEITRFGAEIIPQQEAEAQLRDYLEKRGISYEIKEKEQGVIPMNCSEIHAPNAIGSWINTGERGGNLKPSTGYSFVRSLDHANRLTEGILRQRITKEKVKNRFAYYDRLLLQLLRDKPQHGKAIFTQLFARNKAEHVFTFLDETTSVKQDLALLSTLPLGLFLWAAFRDFAWRIMDVIKNIPVVFWLTLLMLGLMQFGERHLSYAVLASGMLLLGIPHGALDHLHSIKKITFRSMLLYVVLYVLLGALVYLFFTVEPFMATLFFLVYSCWHFGEADFIYWNVNERTGMFLWGMYYLGGILSSHANETMQVLSEMGFSIPGGADVDTAVGTLWIILGGILFLLWKKHSGMLYAILTLLLLQALPLIPAFAIFFIGQHSVHGWLTIKNHVKKSHERLWLNALPFTLGAVVLGGMVAYGKGISWGHLFIFLAALSFPHVVLMFRLNNNWLKSQESHQ